MDIEEAKAKKRKAIGILNENETDISLQWLMDEKIVNFIQLTVEENTGKYEDSVIDLSRCFLCNEKKYELYYLDGRSFFTPDGGGYGGKFKLIYNRELVFETRYFKEYADNEWEGSKLEISFHDFSVEMIKLKQWVEEIPKLVKIEKFLIEQRLLEIQQEKEKEEAIEINENIDLGDYE
jgi:hypothetical protein